MAKKTEKALREELNNASFRFIQAYAPEGFPLAFIQLCGASGRLEDIIRTLDEWTDKKVKENNIPMI